MKIRTTYGEGGAGLSGMPTALHRPIAEVIRGLVDDIANGDVATITSADATDLATAQTLVNEIKAALNAASAAAATKTVEKA